MVKMNILNRTSSLHEKSFRNIFAMIIFALLFCFLNFSCKIDWFSDFDKIRKDEIFTNFYFYNEEDSINSENNIVQGAFFSRNYEIGLELTVSSFPDGTEFSSYSGGKTLLGWKFYRKTGDKTTEIPSSVELNAEDFVENVKVGAISYDFVAVWENTLPKPEPVVNEANYKVQHLRQKLSDNKTSALDEYELYETETKLGTIGKETSASAKNYEGFKAESFAQKIISAEGTTIVQIKYNRISYTIKFNINGGESGSVSDISAVYGGEYTIPDNTFKAKNGFKASENTWNSLSDGNGNTYKSGAKVSNLTATDGETVTLYAVWEKLPSGTGAGTAESPFDNKTTFTSNECSALLYGSENIIEIKAEATSGKAISWGIITIYDSSGAGITDLNYVVIEKKDGAGVTSGSSNATCKITFKNLMPPGTYFININAVVSGITYSDTITAEVLK